MLVKKIQFAAPLILVVLVAGICIPAYPSSKSLVWTTPQPANQSISGKIVAIGDAEFSVEIGKTKDATPVKFLIDENTKVDGRLSVGARATVEYHTEGTNNFAVHVIVTPANGISPSLR